MARSIRRLAELDLNVMIAIEPRWLAFEAGDLTLTAEDLRALLQVPALAPAAGTIAFAVLSVERRPATAIARRLGDITTTCISRWRSLGRDIPRNLAPRIIELAQRWPET